MSKICEIAQNAIKPTLDEMGVEIVDMEFKNGRKGENPTLWIYIYHENGVDLDLLEKVHNAINPILDEADPTNGASYTLNVSSPGLDRAFTKQADFDRNLGKEVEVKLYEKMDGKKAFEGELKFANDDYIIVEESGKEIKIERSKIAKVSMAIKFN